MVSEAAVQQYVLQRLSLLERSGKCYYFRNNSFSGRIVRWNGTQGVVHNNKRGTPDIICVFSDGIFTGIELKSEKGRLSEDQKQVQEYIPTLHARYWVVRSPEGFEILLKSVLT